MSRSDRKKRFGAGFGFLQAAVLFLGALPLGAADFQIYREGEPQAVIVAGEDMKRWARDFSRYARACTGKALDIQPAPSPTRNNIVLDMREQPVTDDSFTIDFPDSRTMRISGNFFSVKSGIVHVLEKYFGVRFLMRYPTHMKRPAGYTVDIDNCFPVSKNISVPRKKIRSTPSFYMRRRLGGSLYYDWKIRDRVFESPNGMTVFAFPSKKYAPDNSWPREILPIHKGKRFIMPKHDPGDTRFRRFMSHWQPCFSNPLSVTIAVKNIFEILEKDPFEPYKPGVKRYYIELSCNDNGGHCECEKCRKVVGDRKNVLGRKHYSELYWNWVNKVTEAVTAKYPSLRVVAHAYRETYEPPSFKLHPNIIVRHARELLSGVIDPGEKTKIEKNFKAWCEKASLFFIYDYYENTPWPKGDYAYVLPRVHMKTYAEMLRMAYKYNIRGIYLESSHAIPITGPAHYICARLFYDIDTDVDAVLRDWCEHAVGKKAAPCLEAYYRFWENYWLRPEIRRTNWAGSAGSTYMILGEAGSYTYPLKREDLTVTRQLLEKVIANAGTPLEKKRARFFMRLYEITVNCVNCLYSVHIQPDGSIADAADAAALVRSIPLAVRSFEALKKEPLTPPGFLQITETALCNLRAVFPYRSDPAVKAELEKLAVRGDLPAALKGQIDILRGVKFRNLLEDGSFENTGDSSCLLTAPGRSAGFDTHHVSDGRRAVKSLNGVVRIVHRKIVPGKTYMVLADVYTEKTSAEGRFNILTNPRIGERNCRYNRLRGIRLNAGWQTVSNTFVAFGLKSTPPDNILIRLWGENFEQDEPVWIDNVRLYRLD